MQNNIVRKSIRGLAVLGAILLLGTSLAAGWQMYRSSIDIFRDMANSYVMLATSNISGGAITRILDNEEAFLKRYEETDFTTLRSSRISDSSPLAAALDLEDSENIDDMVMYWMNVYWFISSSGNLASDIKYFYVVIPLEDELIYLWDSDLYETPAPLERDQYEDEKEKKNLRSAFEGKWDDELAIYRQPNNEILGTAMSPIYDDDGNIIAVAAVDVSITEISQSFLRLLIHIAITITLIMLITVTLYFGYVRSQLLNPIVRLKKATKDMVEHLESDEDEPFAIDIRTGDEIEDLAHSFEDMDQRLKTYIRENAAITAEKERIGTELDLAKRIQADMLPGAFPPFPGRTDFDIYASMTPAKEVGGDFYDFFLCDDDHLCIVMADVSGKGVPAALFMMMSKIMLQNYVMAGLPPKEVLGRVNEQICANNREQMFVTVWLGILELSSGRLAAVNAGHEYPIIGEPGRPFVILHDKHGFVVGGMEGMCYKEYELQLQPGTCLFLYTDGLPEATRADDEMFATGRVLEALNTVRDQSPQQIIERTRREVDLFVGDAPQFDDLTMLYLKYNGQTEREEMRDGMLDDKKLTVEAKIDNLTQVLSFVDAHLEELDCGMKTQMQIDVAVEEMFVNVASYAYASAGKAAAGMVTVLLEDVTDPKALRIIMTDEGEPFDPTAREDPDITLSAQERKIGGLGIYMVKKSMDEVHYAYKDGHNVLTMIKYL